MTTKPDGRDGRPDGRIDAPRIARGTLPPLFVEAVEEHLIVEDHQIVDEWQIVDERPAPRMTMQPPRFTITTPGVMRRQPR